jgi:ribosomal protein S18 acetylase RimI-like enzyme
MNILNSTPGDMPEILKLHEAARQLQTQKNMVIWPLFEYSLIETELAENRQWKIEIDGMVACVWAITYSDRDIWEGKDQDDAIYIHRIATNPDFRGRGFVKNIVDWAKSHARKHGRKYVRLDTLGNNTKLIEHYTGAGFDYLGVFYLKNTLELPLHYQKEPKCLLFELQV